MFDQIIQGIETFCLCAVASITMVGLGILFSLWAEVRRGRTSRRA
jgi:hypothetical protein